MMGCGTGAVLEQRYINQLPLIHNHLNIVLRGEVGHSPPELRREFTEVKFHQDKAEIFVGDSRQGWVESYRALWGLMGLQKGVMEPFGALLGIVGPHRALWGPINALSGPIRVP